jgi:GrpB-like predicted nucleotidyltransferase (UPF0157 family)
MLGLKYGTAEVVPYDPAWADDFRRDQTRLEAVLARHACSIEHVGSTAVPGLSAKPILDIAIGVAAETDVAEVVANIEKLGYVYRGDAGVEGGHVLVLEVEPLVRTHHVHVVGQATPAWRDYLALRDLLIRDPVARRTCASAKSDLARRFPLDRKAYTRAKRGVVERLLVGVGWPSSPTGHRASDGRVTR